MQFRHLMAVDPSLTCSGWALFHVKRGALLGVGKIRSLPSSEDLSIRIRDLQDKIRTLLTQLEIGDRDVLICEAPTTMRDPRAAFKVEQVRGVFETLARERQVVVPGRINPRSVQHEVMGLRGAQLSRRIVKEVAVQVVSTLYGAQLTALGFNIERKSLQDHQDIVDAILIGSLGTARLQSAQQTAVGVETLFEARIKRGASVRRRAA